MRKLVLTLAALAITACSPAADAPKETAEAQCVPEAGSVNLYTARHYDADDQLYAAFTCETGIKVELLEMSADQLIERMRAEGELSPADVILMADAGALWRAQDAGLLQPVSSTILNERVPAELRQPDGLWFGFSRRARVIAYDKAAVDPADVATYAGLADPKFRGGVCVRSSDNIYNLSLMSALIEHWGEARALEWARGVVANFARQPSGGDTDQIRAVAAGACKVALTNSYYFLRIAASDAAEDVAAEEKLALSFPDLDGAGTHVNISGGGIAIGAPNRDNAQRLLEFLTSDTAQGIFAGANHEFPAAPGVTPPADVAAYADFTADPISVAVYGQRQAEAQRVFNQAGWR